MTNEQSDVEVASAAAAGAAAVRSRYGADLDQLAKWPTDFATEADLAAEEAIHRIISAARPSDGFEGEETGTRAGSSDRRWLVNPLCGTLNFAAATPLAPVNVALQHRSVSRPQCRPTRSRMSSSGPTARGLGAARRHRSAVGAVPEFPDRRRELRRQTRCLVPRRTADRRPVLPRRLRATRALQHPRRRLGRSRPTGGLRHRWTPGGQRSLRRGIALCQAAGCVVTDFAGDPVHTGRGLIASADHATHRQLLELARPHLAELEAAR